MSNNTDPIEYASNIVPIIESLYASEGFSEYLLPKIERRIKALSDEVINAENLTQEERENTRQRLLELKSLLSSIENDLSQNKKILKS